MPREVWSIEIQADISKALGQLQSLRSQLATLGSGATAIRPVFDASGVQKGVKTMNTALNSGQRRAQTFIGGLKQDFGNGRIFDQDPLIPPAWRGDWNMSVVLQDEASGVTTGGTIYLTNIHRLYESRSRPAAGHGIHQISIRTSAVCLRVSAEGR